MFTSPNFWEIVPLSPDSAAHYSYRLYRGVGTLMAGKSPCYPTFMLGETPYKRNFIQYRNWHEVLSAKSKHDSEDWHTLEGSGLKLCVYLHANWITKD